MMELVKLGAAERRSAIRQVVVHFTGRREERMSDRTRIRGKVLYWLEHLAGAYAGAEVTNPKRKRIRNIGDAVRALVFTQVVRDGGIRQLTPWIFRT